MALRKLASEMTSRLGVSFTSSMQQPSMSLGKSWARAYAQELKYAESHEWVRVDGDVATIGISDFAQGELGDVVYVELPDIGAEGKVLKKSDTFGVVESVKTASDVYAPVSGEVVEINPVLDNEPEAVNKGPYEGGWLIKIKMSDPSEVEGLLDSDAYKKQIE